jgi:hypothetical protein
MPLQTRRDSADHLRKPLVPALPEEKILCLGSDISIGEKMKGKTLLHLREPSLRDILQTYLKNSDSIETLFVGPDLKDRKLILAALATVPDLHVIQGVI